MCVLLAAVLWGMIGLWTRQLLAGGLTPYSIVVVRNFGGLLMMTVCFLLWRRSVFLLPRRNLKYFFGTGIVSVLLFTICYFSCQAICSLAAAAILLYTAPSMVVLLAALLWRERITRRKAVALLLTLLGCSFVTGAFTGSMTVTLSGIALGLGAGFFYALYSIFARYALQHCDALACTYWTFVFCGLGSLFFVRPTELVQLVYFPQLAGVSIGLVVFSTVLPYLLYTRGLARLGPARASIMASLEPVSAALTGIFVFREAADIYTFLGIFCVLAGIYVLSFAKAEP